jgi:hypothetical protein
MPKAVRFCPRIILPAQRHHRPMPSPHLPLPTLNSTVAALGLVYAKLVAFGKGASDSPSDPVLDGLTRTWATGIR